MGNAREVLNITLEQAGFIREGRPLNGLWDAEQVRLSPDTALRYGEMLSGNIPIDFVYEVPNDAEGLPGTPCIYFKALEEPDQETILELRTRVWNQGRTPTLWIASPDAVLIYDSFARPQPGENLASHRLRELKLIGQKLENLNAFHKSAFDTGRFFQEGPGCKIDRKQRVDAVLLQDLSATEQRLTFSEGLATEVAHSLLGRAIFVCYLEDRKILPPSFFQEGYGCESFRELLLSVDKTYFFFEWLRRTFNGDLFPITLEERESLRPHHLQILRHFLHGDEMRLESGYQKRIWPYRFDVIPVELISSIYETFAHSRDAQSAEAGSVHYTRINLVELVLSIAMRDLPYTARILDPACGSGVFLVEALRRLVWLREQALGRPLVRTELHEMLRGQIFGIDCDPGAIHVAAFSLYLTLLELDPDPQPPAALRLPPLRGASASGEPPPNLYVQDFLNTGHLFNRRPPFATQGFDLVVGNPPWTALSEKTAPRDPEDRGQQWGLEYCKRKLIPDCKPDQAFMVRAQDFTGPDGRIAFVVASRILYQETDKNPDKRWFGKFLSRHTVQAIVNLADLVDEEILFGGGSSTRYPAAVIIFSAQSPLTSHSVIYFTPKWYSGVKKRGEILIHGDDIQAFPQALLRDRPFLWKSAFRGTPRDSQLLSRLQQLPDLDQVLVELGIRQRARGVTIGKGKLKPVGDLANKPYLTGKSADRYGIDISNLPLFSREGVARKSNRMIFDLPALVLFRSLLDCRPRAALVLRTEDRRQLVVDQLYYAISFAGSSVGFARKLNAILNSDLALYMSFMLGPALGWDRRLIEVEGWLQIPLPETLADTTSDAAWAPVLQLENWLRTNWRHKMEAAEVAEMERELNLRVFELYGLSEQEVVTVEDAVSFVIKPLLRRKQIRYLESERRPKRDELRAYAERMQLQLHALLRHQDLELGTIVFQGEAAPVCACHFSPRPASDSGQAIEFIEIDSSDQVLSRISDNLRWQVADRMYVQRNLRVYDSGGFWIVKPAEKHLWSRASALNDADTIVREHMEMMNV